MNAKQKRKRLRRDVRELKAMHEAPPFYARVPELSNPWADGPVDTVELTGDATLHGAAVSKHLREGGSIQTNGFRLFIAGTVNFPFGLGKISGK